MNAGAYMTGRGYNRKRIEDIRDRTFETQVAQARVNMEEVRRKREERELIDRIMKESSQQTKVDRWVAAAKAELGES